MTGAFYFDLASPHCYLVAESILHALPGPIEWRPVLARGLSGAEDAVGPSGAQPEGVPREEIERGVRELGLQPLRWPARFPFDSERAMLAATYAKAIGRTVPFAQAAFRQAFAGGHALDSLDFVLIAAAACEMHPRALLASIDLRSIGDELAGATAAAAAVGVGEVPAIRIGESIFSGPRALADAVLAVGPPAPARISS